MALAHFCSLYGIACPLLRDYNEHRDERFKELIAASAATSMPFTKDDCKRLMLKIVNGGLIWRELKAWGCAAPTSCARPAARTPKRVGSDSEHRRGGAMQADMGECRGAGAGGWVSVHKGVRSDRWPHGGTHTSGTDVAWLVRPCAVVTVRGDGEGLFVGEWQCEGPRGVGKCLLDGKAHL